MQKKKFFVIFAYPGVSGYLHVGHLRSYTYADSIAKYKKMRGYYVFFPVEVHASGLPAIAFSKKVAENDSATIDMLKAHGVDEKTMKKLTDPVFAVRFFLEEYIKTFKKMGYSIIEDTKCTTIDEGYKRFIRWQMDKLKEKGYIIKKAHYAPFCPNCGPIAVDRSETDISKGGDAKIIAIKILKIPLKDGSMLPVSLAGEGELERIVVPEGEEYLKVHFGKEILILPKSNADKIKMQKDWLKESKTTNIRKIIGKSVSIKNKKVPVEYTKEKIAFGSGIKGIVKEGKKANYEDTEEILDFDKEVVCRCGSEVLIKRVEDQLFINYRNSEVKERAKRAIKNMKIAPEEYKRELLNNIIDWYGDRACIRWGKWLGTEWQGGIVEPISDSVIYPAYYVISEFINKGKIDAKQLDNSFFDYVFLGKGNVSEVCEKTGIEKRTIMEVKKRFEFLYPVDMNCGGKEHKTVHFPVYIMAHTMLFPEKYWPKGIFVNWWLVNKGGKISKSKGGAVPIPNIVEKYGSDALRLFYLAESTPHSDVIWSENKVLKYKAILKRIENDIENFSKLAVKKKGTYMSAWVLSRASNHIGKYIKYMDDYKIREAALVIFNFAEDIEWCIKKGFKIEKSAINAVLKSIVAMLYPIAPNLAKKYAERMKIKEIRLEKLKGIVENREIEQKEEMLKKLISSINNVEKILKNRGISPRKVKLKCFDKKEEEFLKMNKKFMENMLKLSILFDNSIDKEGKPGRPAFILE